MKYPMPPVTEETIRLDAKERLRDDFAAKAAIAMLLNNNWSHSPWDEIAEDAYALADAMLKARTTGAT